MVKETFEKKKNLKKEKSSKMFDKIILSAIIVASITFIYCVYCLILINK